MSLNWNVSGCRDYEELLEGDEWRITETAIWMSVISGFHEITEDNWSEWYARVAMWGRIVERREEDPLTPEQVHRRIGLHTNCWPDLTHAKWVKEKLRLDHYLNDIRRNGENKVDRSLQGEASSVV